MPSGKALPKVTISPKAQVNPKKNSLIFQTQEILVACGTEKVEYTIELTEFAFSPDTLEVQVGQEVTLNLVNKGALQHEFMVGRNVMMMEGMANGFEMDFLEMASPTITGQVSWSWAWMRKKNMKWIMTTEWLATKVSW
jgi:uncharacterized cupredoxin-like copper-binding protein